MKNLMIASIVLLSSASFAGISIMPVGPVPFSSEQVLVKEITQSGDLMPGGPHKPLLTTLAVEVMSSGCTQASDFEVRVNKSRSQMMDIVRTQPDLCKAISAPTTVYLETTDLDLASSKPIQVMNPLLAVEHVTH